jgi:hypothetical protein
MSPDYNWLHPVDPYLFGNARVSWLVEEETP